MPGASPRPTVRRVAGLRLRGAAAPLRVAWPQAPGGGPPALVVAVGLEGADELCAHAGAVVLAAPGERLGDAAAALDWAAAYAQELGADGGRLAVAGGALAAALALHARDRGWPALARQALIHPGPDAKSPSPRGAAPATVVCAGDGDRRRAERLRRAGVEVEVLREADPARALAAAGRSLRRALDAEARR